MMGRPKILQMNGLSIKDFDSVAEAMQTADDLVEQSAADYSFTKETIHHDNPLCVKCYYIYGHGKKHTMSGTERKDISGVTDGKVKHKMLTGFGDITGGASLMDKPDQDLIKLEFPHFSEMKVAAERNKSHTWSIMGHHVITSSRGGMITTPPLITSLPPRKVSPQVSPGRGAAALHLEDQSAFDWGQG